MSDTRPIKDAADLFRRINRLNEEAEWNEAGLRATLVDEGIDPNLLVESVFANVQRLLRESTSVHPNTLNVNFDDFDVSIVLGKISERDLMLVAGAADFHAPTVSKDGRIRAEARLLEGPTLQIEVCAVDESLRGAMVICGLRSMRTSEIFYEAKFPLQFDNGLTGIWEVALKGDLSEQLKAEEAEIFVRSLGELTI
jgi:hypothetical protein